MINNLNHNLLLNFKVLLTVNPIWPYLKRV
jgi:hypothetical protein